MIDVQTVIDQITNATGYDVSTITSSNPVLQDLDKLPVVLVGYGKITASNPSETLQHDVVSTNGEDLVQSFEVNIVCSEADFRNIWVTVYKSLIGTNPDPLERTHTSFTYFKGGVAGRDNSRLWHVDIWNIGFPTSKPLI